MIMRRTPQLLIFFWNATLAASSQDYKITWNLGHDPGRSELADSGLEELIST